MQLGELADDVGDHLRRHGLVRTEQICGHVDAGRHADAVREWTQLCSDVAVSDCELAGATWSALGWLVDDPRRVAAGLVLPPRP